MLTHREVDEAYNRVAELHNAIVREHPTLEASAITECLNAGISVESMDELVTHILNSYSKIPVSVLFREAPWVIQVVSHSIIVGMELGRTVVETVASAVPADFDVPDYPPE